MSAGSIVIHFDVFEYRLSHFLPGGESLTVNGLDLERVKETLGAGITILSLPFLLALYTVASAWLNNSLASIELSGTRLDTPKLIVTSGISL